MGTLVHVLHTGRNDAEGYFYYVMELADAAEVADHAPHLLGLRFFAWFP